MLLDGLLQITFAKQKLILLYIKHQGTLFFPTTSTMDEDNFTGCLSFLNDGYGPTLQIIMIFGCLSIMAAGVFVMYLDFKVGLPFLILGACFSSSWFYYDYLTQQEKKKDEAAKIVTSDEEKTEKKNE